ncbi:MAG: 3-oxoacyl-[acyl-carrier-protein] reductase [Phycisphaerales bacterium]|nr:3-oxoacyl-[acyl-carrier-protein] reductase [Phycisphaerales bacterium]
MTEQRVAIVTGASRGIGRAVALRLASEGRHVVCVSRSQGPLDELVSEIQAAGGSASALTCDITDFDAITSMIDTVVNDQGRLDILVNNAGITKDNLILRMSDEEWDDVINTNLKSVFVACRAAARPMMKNKFGRIVNIASTSGLVGNSGQSNYAAAKSGLTGFTKTVARELGKKNITANCVAPGFIETDMTKDLPAAVTEHIKSVISTRDLGKPEDIAAAVAYVTSDDAGYLTGQTIAVDGGMTMC